MIYHIINTNEALYTDEFELSPIKLYIYELVYIPEYVQLVGIISSNSRMLKFSFDTVYPICVGTRKFVACVIFVITL